MIGPDAIARESIDSALMAAGLVIRDMKEFTRSAALRRSTLKDAVSGTIVLENQSDKPASALLDHIRQKRSA